MCLGIISFSSLEKRLFERFVRFFLNWIAESGENSLYTVYGNIYILSMYSLHLDTGFLVDTWFLDIFSRFVMAFPAS